VRIESILRNRRITPSDLEARLGRRLRVADLVAQDRDIDLGDLEALASLLKRPWPYFLIDDPEPPPATGQDHRTVANQLAGVTPELAAELEAASEMLDAAIELFPGDRVQLPTVRIDVDVPIETAGERVRSALAVAVDRQLAAKDEYAALRLWVEAVHRQCIYVAQRRLEDPTVRAFSLRRDQHCMLVVDTQDTPYARVFSIIHEYVHVVMRATGLCDLDDHATIERFCNAVAAAALLPPGVLADSRTHPWGRDDSEDDATLRRLSRHAHVSQAALLIRMKDLGYITQTRFDMLDGRRQTRRSEPKDGGSYYPSQINRVGRRFAGEVLASLDSGRLARQDAAALLGVAEHNMARYRAEFAAGSGR
jgi:Zn-dependent peptidase ImmA (M78 family)